MLYPVDRFPAVSCSPNSFCQFKHKQIEYLFTMHTYAVRPCVGSNLLGTFLSPGKGCHHSRLHRAPVRTILDRLASFSSSREEGSLASGMPRTYPWMRRLSLVCSTITRCECTVKLARGMPSSPRRWKTVELTGLVSIAHMPSMFSYRT